MSPNWMRLLTSYIQLDAVEKPPDETREHKMREAEESADVVGRLRGEEKSSRRHSRGETSPIPLFCQDTLGVEVDDTGGDEPELAPEDVSWGKRDHETLDTAEENMTTEGYVPEEIPKGEALAENPSLKELDGDFTMQRVSSEEVSTIQSGQGHRDELGPNGDGLPLSKALALSPIDSNGEIRHITDYLNFEGGKAHVGNLSKSLTGNTEAIPHSTEDSGPVDDLVSRFEPANMILPPSPLLSQDEAHPEPDILNSSVIAGIPVRNFTVSSESYLERRVSSSTHEPYYVQAPVIKAPMGHTSRIIYESFPVMFTGVDHASLMAESLHMPTETSPWETVDEDETSEQVWETTDDDETMEKSVGDFRFPRDTPSDIAEVIQEANESDGSNLRHDTQEVPRGFAPSAAHSPDHPSFHLHNAYSSSPRVSQLNLAHYTHSPNHSNGDGPEHQFESQDWAAWCESEIAAGALPENLEFHPHYLDTISENSDDEFVVRKLATTTHVDERERLHPPIVNEASSEGISQGISQVAAMEHSAQSDGSLDKSQGSLSEWPPNQREIPGETLPGNEAPEWPDTFAEEDESEVETQRLRYVFDHTRFISETSTVSPFREIEQHTFDDESIEEEAAAVRVRDHERGHFDQRFHMTQARGEENQQHPQRGFTWLSTRSSSIDQSHDINFEPLLDDGRLETIDVAFAPNEALTTGQISDHISEDASISDLELRASSPNEVQRNFRYFNYHSSPYPEPSSEEDHRGLNYHTGSMRSSDFGSPTPMGLGVDLVDHPIPAKGRPVQLDSSSNQHRPILVHSSTQTDEDLVQRTCSPSGDRYIEEPRSPTPAIVLPDLGDPKVRALARAKSLRKKHRQHFRELEETVATAVVLCAAAQELSPPYSPHRYGPVNNNFTETLDITRGLAQASSDVVSSEISAQHSVDESDLSSSVADLSTDDERHRHRSRRTHHHSSRPKETVNGDEHRSHHHRHHKSRDENEQLVKTSSDRSIFSRHRKEEPLRHNKEEYRRHDGSHESSSHRRHRTPEEQAAHDRRKEERRAQRELERERERQLESAREQKGKEAETTPPSSERHSPRSSRRSGQSDLRPGHSHSERRVSIKEEPSPVSSKKLFSFRGGESILDAARVSPEDEIEASNRVSTRSHSRPHRDSGDAPRARREHRESREPREPRESRESRDQREHRRHREHKEPRESREIPEQQASGDVPRPRSSRHHDEVRDESASRQRERSSRVKVEDDAKFSARSMPESEGRVSTRSRADSDARRSTRSRGNDSDGKPSSRPSSSSHKPRSSDGKDDRPRHSSRREERQRERDAERRKREAPASGLKSMFKRIFT